MKQPSRSASAITWTPRRLDRTQTPWAGDQSAGVSGTHAGHGLGIEPTGRRFEAEQMHVIRVADGRIAEHWGVRDDAGMMRQLAAA